MLKIITLLLLPFFAGSQELILEGKLISNSDGDSFTLLTKDFKKHAIRLNGIDCPEKGQDFANTAKNFTKQFCAGKTLLVVTFNKDKYKRYIANVSANGQSLNQALVAQGLAWHYTKYSTDKTLSRLEQEARQKKLHIWSLNNPMPPWIFRKRGSLQLLENLQAGHVYICQSKGAKTYHYKMCEGLSKCTKGVRQTPLSKALQTGKKHCGYCRNAAR